MKRLLYICCLIALLGFDASAGILAQFRTVFGDIEVELLDQDKPITVANFIRYVQSELYRDGLIHRCNPAFVIQGGGYFVANRNTTSAIIDTIPTFAPITNEFGVGRFYSNLYGTIAMAKVGGDPNSATSQWFFNLTNNAANLDTQNGGFTVFGRVVRGTNVLNVFRAFKAGRATNTIVNIGGPFTELPVLRTNLTYNDLIYVDVSLLNVQVQNLTNNTRQISWNSIAGRTNHVEFTTNLPPTWRSLLVTNGTGNVIKTVYPTTNAPRRFYRVRVDY